VTLDSSGTDVNACVWF